MPKATYSRIIDQSSDAGFRQWASDLSTALRACLTQTTDTGQVDWTLGTQTKPGTNSFPYYDIFRFSDSLQGTRPVFIKVEYGTASNTIMPGVRISVASGSNGAGALTAPTLMSAIVGNQSAVNASVPASTYVCAKDGYFGLAWGCMPTPAPATTPHYQLIVDRTRDTDGVGTGNGLLVIYNVSSAGPGTLTAWSYDLGASINPGPTTWSLTPTTTTQSSLSALAKLFPMRFFSPDEYAITGMLNYLATEITPYTEFDVAPLPGMATQRYLALAGNLTSMSASNSNLWQAAMRYET